MKAKQSDGDLGHDIVPGDWVIRARPDKGGFQDSVGFDMGMFRMGPPSPNDDPSFTDHAVFVMDATRTHLTIFEPLMGRPVIIEIDKLPGTWYYATQGQVEVTWILASMTRSRESAMSIQTEKEKFKYRRRR